MATQGHTLRADDLVATLVVEAALHHLDLIVELSRPGPGPAALAVVRSTLGGLLGQPVPLTWDDKTYALAGTGRRELTGADVSALGDLADRFPLLS